MSKYQRLEQSTSSVSHAEAINANAANVTLLLDDSSSSSGNGSGSGSANDTRRITRPYNSIKNNNTSSSGSSKSSSPFNFGHTAAATQAVRTKTPASAEHHVLDTEAEATLEVPLLRENNHDYTFEHQLLPNNNNSNSSSLHSSSNILYVRDAPLSPCHCNLPGFSENLKNKATQDAKFKILLAITLCCVFMIIEFLGGYFAGSLAIMTDAAHLASDCISFVIGLLAIWLGGRPPDRHMSFGYKRMEVMGALISILGIWILTATLIIVAAERLYSNDFDLNATTMMVISGIGILINIVMVFILHGSALLQGAAAHGHSHAHAHAHSHAAPAAIPSAFIGRSRSDSSASSSDVLGGIGTATALANGNGLKHTQNCDSSQNLNLRAAMIHVIGDLVQSIGVFLASVLIQIYPNAKFADPLCTVMFSFIVFMTTVRLFRESIAILLDAVPSEISMQSLEHDLCNIEGVKSVHHLNVWNHTNNHSVMMAHLVIDFLTDSNTVLKRATKLACGSKYNIKHCTIQIERLT